MGPAFSYGRDGRTVCGWCPYNPLVERSRNQQPNHLLNLLRWSIPDPAPALTGAGTGGGSWGNLLRNSGGECGSLGSCRPFLGGIRRRSGGCSE